MTSLLVPGLVGVDDVAAADEMKVVVMMLLALPQVLDLRRGHEVPDVLQDVALAQRTGALQGVDRILHLEDEQVVLSSDEH